MGPHRATKRPWVHGSHGFPANYGSICAASRLKKCGPWTCRWDTWGLLKCYLTQLACAPHASLVCASHVGTWGQRPGARGQGPGTWDEGPQAPKDQGSGTTGHGSRTTGPDAIVLGQTSNLFAHCSGQCSRQACSEKCPWPTQPRQALPNPLPPTPRRPLLRVKDGRSPSDRKTLGPK